MKDAPVPRPTLAISCLEGSYIILTIFQYSSNIVNLLSIWSGYHKGMWLNLVFYHKEMYTYTDGSHSSSKDETENISVFSLLIPYVDNYQIQRYFIKN